MRITDRPRNSTASHDCHLQPSFPAPPLRYLRSLSRLERHHPLARRNRLLNYGFLNICSLNHKVDDLLDFSRDHALGVILIAESWHDHDSNSVCRLRQMGFNVLDCPRPRPPGQLPSLMTNHGGLVAFGSSQIQLSRINLGANPTSFEHLCFRVTTCSSSNVILLLYRTGTISSLFFDELVAVLDSVMTYSVPVIVTGDLNIHVERLDDPHALKLFIIMSSCGMSCRVNVPTHVLGGTLDVVFTSVSSPLSVLSILDLSLIHI